MGWDMEQNERYQIHEKWNADGINNLTLCTVLLIMLSPLAFSGNHYDHKNWALFMVSC